MVPLKNKQLKDKDNRLLVNGSKDFEPVPSGEKEEEVDVNDRLIRKGINATIVLGAGTFAVTKLLTIDHDYWHVSRLISLLMFNGLVFHNLRFFFSLACN